MSKEGLFDYTGLNVQLALNHKNKAYLNKQLKISWDTIAKFSTGESINMKILRDICIELGCDIGDIVSIKKDQP